MKARSFVPTYFVIVILSEKQDKKFISFRNLQLSTEANFLRLSYSTNDSS